MEQINKKINPRYSAMHDWDNYAAQLQTEFIQSKKEGKDVDAYEELFRTVSKLPEGELKARIADVLFDLILNMEDRGDFSYHEPSDLDTIRLLCPARQPGFGEFDPEKLYDKIYGAWIGRVSGCLLGKPVEGIRTSELIPFLKETGNYPMTRYILDTDVTDEIAGKYRYRLKGRCYPDTIDCAPMDDDTNYTVLACLLIERYGVGFTPWDVTQMWIESQPREAYYTAERVAWRNAVAGFYPPESASYKNPYREWIGAQIRGDFFGYINPGDPKKAAEMAWRDASISHVKNGIYGEMFAAAMIAAAAVTENMAEIIEAGLGQIPETSRLAESIREILSRCSSGAGEEDVFDYIHSLWDENAEYDWGHTIPNAMVVAASLLYSGGDYGRAICLSVQTGFDTDCNGATVGSVMGMRNGFAAIPSEWYAPIRDTLDTAIFGAGKVSLSQMAEKTLQIALNKI